jgi:excisionase family DNA binding protein
MRNNQQTTEPAFLTIPQVCERLNIKKTLFYELRSAGVFGVKSFRVGKKVLYNTAELEKYIEASAAQRRFITASEWQRRKK